MLFGLNFMITASEIAPSPVLATYIRSYTLREFDTNGNDLQKAWHASNEVTLVFFFKALPEKLVDPNTGKILKRGSFGDLLGTGTKYNGEMILNGMYSFLEIQFRLNGFYRLFKFPVSEITDLIVNGMDVHNKFKDLHEMLLNASGIIEMGDICDRFFLSELRKQEKGCNKNNLECISQILAVNPAYLNVDLIAREINMSFRNLERCFKVQVGMSPKLYLNNCRFNRVLSSKLRNPHKDLNTLAFESGYYDQSHFIRDFKKFAGSTPNQFFKTTPLVNQVYLSEVE